jgi:hypothetical protein
MKNKLKNILGNGLPFGLVFAGLSFLLGYYIFNVSLKNSLWLSSLFGVSALLVNGYMYNRFSKPLKLLENITTQFYDSESLVIQAPCNHLIEESLVPGKLFLTTQRIIFKPYKPTVTIIKEYSWKLNDLEPIGFYGSIWNSGGEFLLQTKNDISLMFEVNKLKTWKDFFRKT